MARPEIPGGQVLLRIANQEDSRQGKQYLWLAHVFSTRLKITSSFCLKFVEKHSNPSSSTVHRWISADNKSSGEALSEECPRDPAIDAAICDSSICEPECVTLDQSVKDGSKDGAQEVRVLSQDVVLGPRLDEIKEEVTEEKASSRWMRVRQQYLFLSDFSCS